jgi:hypothetical protein
VTEPEPEPQPEQPLASDAKPDEKTAATDPTPVERRAPQVRAGHKIGLALELEQ